MDERTIEEERTLDSKFESLIKSITDVYQANGRNHMKAYIIKSLKNWATITI